MIKWGVEEFGRGISWEASE